VDNIKDWYLGMGLVHFRFFNSIMFPLESATSGKANGPIWFGVLITVLCMVGIVAPPVATNFFVVKGLAGEEVPLGTIVKGILIFLIPLSLSLALIIAFPSISTFLPRFMIY
jgi:TRAP-type C4-dicarboxylate transport system permease large subunit